ncbi:MULTISPECIES: maleylpyruvate isomerase family mycothiol-dependent enzyme [unclassified Streptomyces]|uniref:Maleylpyruvate isomerase family mycothiol-dependent enzyme n=1 Tax=Streptomyces sanglieri TaxID=193460 RepID=A0ABW2WXK2_9ACTN|nr:MULTISPECIES: maleylpyruvate isomerase family mycothiol-dependent enzyme [unclassified Streptomyces]MCX4395508.1 maleylpyruvate isomerase family mycothiol-dependent enzyme [Streptomyces sp. NBC_01767]MCX5101862.1 maleylpyruvate isomerase family mycothiol-dependent enzyme [Streptomyces sp. NBC_00439]MCX5501654.1 maleylpyruvate isomerase family mycothiol-dependent enzyme [Streptomyces sp. NBC_00052]MCX5549810.1 maleylpyruvate isomerase family mycothiol-dependent enzyme [Streptomyces sp. NBC_00
MTVHPSLQTYADAWTHSIESIAELVKPLAEGEWNRRTPCPAWSVRDIVSHIIGMECEQLGDPRPIHSLPRDLYHVQSDFARYMEMQVDVRRHHTSPEMTSELEYTIIRRARQLRNETRDPETMVRAPLGAEQTLELALRMRVFDVWVHEQDLRATLGRPGNLDSPGATVVRDTLLEALPKVVAKDAGAPANSAIVLDVHGPLEFLRTVRVDAEGRGSVDGSPSLGPVVTLAMDWETYFLLACGRVRAGAVADRVKIEGDQDLATAILQNFAVTP